MIFPDLFLTPTTEILFKDRLLIQINSPVLRFKSKNYSNKYPIYG